MQVETKKIARVSRKLAALAKASEGCGKRCKRNMLTADTWIQESFYGLADRLKELESELKKIGS